MIIYPALDLRSGKVVRLRQGDPAQQTIYGDDPLLVAQRWIAAGAEWLHVVNLDGAFTEKSTEQNDQVVSRLITCNLPIQLGGGLRSLADIEHAFAIGVARVVIGTLAVEQPEILPALLDRWGPERIAVALDARDGKVTTRGWQQATDMTPIELGSKMAAWGVKHALYTDVNRDGELSGVNVPATVDLAQATGLHVIASGGVSAIQDIIALCDSHQVAGAILGKSLYEGLIDLGDAIRLVREKTSH